MLLWQLQEAEFGGTWGAKLQDAQDAQELPRLPIPGQVFIIDMVLYRAVWPPYEALWERYGSAVGALWDLLHIAMPVPAIDGSKRETLVITSIY